MLKGVIPNFLFNKLCLITKILIYTYKIMSVCINNKSFKDPTKYKQMLEINNKLGIKTGSTNKIVFVYSEPKVGSTTIVSSLRIYEKEKITIIHVHVYMKWKRISDFIYQIQILKHTALLFTPTHPVEFDQSI